MVKLLLTVSCLLTFCSVDAQDVLFKRRGNTGVTGGGGGSCGGSAPTFDAATICNGPTNGPTSISWSHTCTGANGLICVFIGQGQGNPAKTIDTVTYNGDALTRLSGYFGSDGNFCHTDMWYRLAPDTGGSFTITVTAASAVDQFVGGSVSLANVCQSTPFGTPVPAFCFPAAGCTGTASTTVSSASTELVVGSLMTDDESGIAVTVGTQRLEIENIEGDTAFNVLTATGAASVTPTWTFDVSVAWAVSAVSVKGN